MIIAFLNPKGGPGKTTLALNLGAHRAHAGRSVLAVDADPGMHGMSAWIELRSQLDGVAPVQCVALPPGLLGAQVRALAAHYDDVVIDVAGIYDPDPNSPARRALSAALLVADRVVTPFRPGQFDLQGLATMSALVADARLMSDKLDALAVINQAPTNDGNADERDARAAAALVPEYRLAATAVHIGKPFRRCSDTGLSVLEMGPEAARAALEIEALAAEVWA